MSKIYFLFLLILSSCISNYPRCEAFNLKKLPISIKYYDQVVKYTNGKDTLIFQKVKSVIDSQYVLDDPLNNPCNPYFYIETWNKEFDFGIKYYFNYTPNEKQMEFSAFVDLNSVKMEINKLKSDTMVFKEKYIDGSVIDSLRINRIIISNWRITEFDYLNGQKWKIVN